MGKSSSNSSASVSVSGSSSGIVENRPHCVCWCGSWAEVYVRGPTGDVSWVIRLQNQVHLVLSIDCMMIIHETTFFYDINGKISNFRSIQTHLWKIYH